MSAGGASLSRAIHVMLSNDGELAGLVGNRIFDRVPDRATLPYITYGTLRSAPLDAEGVEEHALVIDCWSRGHGRREVEAILARVVALLTANVPSPENAHGVSLALSGSEIVADDDLDLEHGIARLRAVTQPFEN